MHQSHRYWFWHFCIDYTVLLLIIVLKILGSYLIIIIIILFHIIHHNHHHHYQINHHKWHCRHHLRREVIILSAVDHQPLMFTMVHWKSHQGPMFVSGSTPVQICIILNNISSSASDDDFNNEDSPQHDGQVNFQFFSELWWRFLWGGVQRRIWRNGR